ncbi:MAG: hypothetical protein HZA93_10790 [Verrucomicrobia bacterium]|nr:hypothetical protein [Verrucomicrobiota bacterium]
MQQVRREVVALVARLRRRLGAASFVARHRVRSQDFTRRRQLPFAVVVRFTLRKSLKSLQRHLHEFLAELAGGALAAPMTAGAYTHARAKLRHTAFIELNRDCVLPAIYGPAPVLPLTRWKGHRAGLQRKV